MKFGLYIENHKEIRGITDYVNSLKQIFSKNKINLCFAKNNQSKFDIIFIIEEFTFNIEENKKFLLLQKKQGTKLCLVHTEFIDKNGFFNIFNKKDIMFRKFIKTDLIYKLHKEKGNYLYKILKYFILIFYIIFGLILGLRYKEISRRIYFALRDYSYNKSKHLFDYNIALSDNVYTNLREEYQLSNLYYLQPYIW